MWNPYLVPGPLLGPETAKVKDSPALRVWARACTNRKLQIGSGIAHAVATGVLRTGRYFLEGRQLCTVPDLMGGNIGAGHPGRKVPAEAGRHCRV